MTMASRLRALVPTPEYSRDQSLEDCSRTVLSTIAIAVSNLPQRFFFGRRRSFAELTLPVADIPGIRDLRSDVVVQIAGQMKH